MTVLQLALIFSILYILLSIYLMFKVPPLMQGRWYVVFAKSIFLMPVIPFCYGLIKMYYSDLRAYDKAADVFFYRYKGTNKELANYRNTSNVIDNRIYDEKRGC